MAYRQGITCSVPGNFCTVLISSLPLSGSNSSLVSSTRMNSTPLTWPLASALMALTMTPVCSVNPISRASTSSLPKAGSRSAGSIDTIHTLRAPLLIEVCAVSHPAPVLPRRHAGRPRAHHRHPLAVLGCSLPVDLDPARPGVVGGESLQRFDRDRVLGPLHPATFAVGLAGMVAEPAQHR